MGGEISEQPGVFGEGIFVFSSTVIGVVSKKKIIDGSRIKKGDKVIALASNGLHTNGYSLVRKLITEKPAILKAKVEKKHLLTPFYCPHTAYYPYLKDILDSPKVRGLAHITGDGIWATWSDFTGGFECAGASGQNRSPAGFQSNQKIGGVPEEDMINNLNIGVGMTMVTAPREETAMIKYLEEKGIHAYHIGEIIADEENTVNFSGKLNWGK